MLRRVVSVLALAAAALVLCVVPKVMSAVSGADSICLGCHGDRNLSVVLGSGEKLSLFVNAETFSSSAHSALDCTACHSEIAPSAHPSGAAPQSRSEMAQKGSAVCRKCHAKFRTGIHAKLADAKQGRRLCVECHSPHAVPVAPKTSQRDAGYCLGCHRNQISLSFRDGSSVSLKVNPDDIQASVHNKLYCSDCHFGFSVDEHPTRNFRSRRDYSIAASESCRRCHFDKYTKTLESIHYAMLSQGNLNAPVCSDCHGSHMISTAARERTQSAKRCERCHGEIYRTYASSVHGSALVNEHNQDVPVCADCHRAHNIEDPRTFDYRERVPQMCGNCHANKQLMNKYGLSTNVLTSYLQDFHGVTLKLYRKQKSLGDVSTLKPIAVCIDCHGIHDITPTTGPKASILKTNLVNRCRKCHPSASDEFPSSWISHYEPSPKRAPLVFAINLVYKIFIPFMMAGLILQILLHIWRYAVNR